MAYEKKQDDESKTDTITNRKKQLDRYNENRSVCFFCFGSGYIHALLKSDLTLEYVFACPNCSASQILKLPFPEWKNERDSEKFEILKIGQKETFSRQKKRQFDFYLSKSVNIKPDEKPVSEAKVETIDW